ncbi:MAG: DUF4349 domain-containing protein [Bacteroidetes bacterium]|nr:DUF4349 domain-containing protein [Bacteroidota bacterium]
MKTNKQLSILILSILIMLILFTGCGGGGGEYAGEEPSYSDSSSGNIRMSSAESMAAAGEEPAPNLLIEEGRKKILTANISLEVPDLEDAETSLKHLVADFDGWIDRSSMYENSISLTIRVPAERLDTFLLRTGELGEVISRSISADDVTDYYFDTETRLETLRVLQEKYTEYLKTAKNMEDIISIERELNSTISEIESMERTMRRLDGQISYSTVYFYGELPPEEQVSVDLPSVAEGLKRLGYGFISLLYYIGIGLLYAVIFGVPIILVLGLIYLVGWGRIGLIRKFFRLLSHRKSNK